MVPIDASTAGHRRMVRAPRRQEYGATHVITSQYKFSLSLILEANLCMAFDADGPAPPVHEKGIGQRVAFSISIIHCSYFSFLMEFQLSEIQVFHLLQLGLKTKIFHRKQIKMNLRLCLSSAFSDCFSDYFSSAVF